MAIMPIIILATTPTKLNIISVEAYGVNTVTGAVYLLVIVEYGLYFFLGLRKLINSYKSKRTGLNVKTQIRYIFAGVILTLVPAVLTNAILPTLGYGNSVFYGPNSVIFLAVFMSVAIVKHRLLDIRLVVARVLAYVFVISSLIVVYAFIIIVIAGNISGGVVAQFVRQVLPFAAAMLLAVAYAPLKKFFDKQTNRVFYQDAYNTQSLLDELNSVLVSNVELRKLLEKSAKAISSNLKSSYIHFYIQGRFFPEDKKINISDEKLKAVGVFLSRQRTSLIVEDLEDSGTSLKNVLFDNGVAAVIGLPVSSSGKSHEENLMILGDKKSGGPYSPQDLKVLEIIANEMVIAIQNALRFEEIQNFAKTLEVEVEEKTRNLRKANEKLKKLDETKDDFISMASHQLRTPLTSVKGYVSMVLEGDVGKITNKQKELLDQAFVSSQRMVYLIADLLNVSRLRTGKFVIEAKSVNLSDIVEGEINQLIETAKGRGLKLKYAKPKEFPVLMLDETKIRQVIMNFADNAIYYTPTGGHIEVALQDTGETVEFTVIDDGIGVPKEEQHHLFNKFYRAGNAKKARPDGTGLGLFMAKKVVVAQGGAIIFKTTENKGSTFGFSFSKKLLSPEHYKGPAVAEVVADQEPTKQ